MDNLILLGSPGVGKGTQAKIVAQKLNLVHISTGDLLREAVNNSTPLGKLASSFMEKGELVPDKVMLDLLKEFMQNKNRGFILDGFPRTIKQAEGLREFLATKDQKVSRVIFITLPEGEIIKRLSARRICGGCNLDYNLISKPPKDDNLCDACKKPLLTRPDDTPPTIKNRLQVYQENTLPLLDYYRKEGSLLEIPGSGSKEEVSIRIIKNL